MKIGLLEWGYRENVDSLTAIQQVIDYACAADELGFSRFWLTEHHNPNKLIPFTNPDILIALIAGMTNVIKVGAAGVLLKMHSAYSVATNYKFINNLYPDRIDLGIAKGDPGAAYLRENFYDITNKGLVYKKIAELYDLLYHEMENFVKRGVSIPPFGGTAPSLWYLTRFYRDTEVAIQCKMNLCRTIMHGKDALSSPPQKEELLHFRQQFEEQNKFKPEVSLALAVVIGDSLSEAEKKVKILDAQNPDDKSIQPLAVTAESLIHLLEHYQHLYGIDEFIIYDLEGENLQRIENLKKISALLKSNLSGSFRTPITPKSNSFVEN